MLESLHQSKMKINKGLGVLYKNVEECWTECKSGGQVCGVKLMQLSVHWQGCRLYEPTSSTRSSTHFWTFHCWATSRLACCEVSLFPTFYLILCHPSLSSLSLHALVFIIALSLSCLCLFFSSPPSLSGGKGWWSVKLETIIFCSVAPCPEL